MASGSFESSTGSNFEIGVEWSSAADASTNSSKVTVNVYLSHYSISCGALSGSYVKIGTSTHSFSKAVSSSVNTKQKTYIASFAQDVAHGADGTKSVEIGAGYVFRGTYNGVYIDTLTVSRTVALDSIPRASELSHPSSLTLGSEARFTVSSRLSSYKHRLEFKVGGSDNFTGYLASLSPTVTVPSALAAGILSSDEAAGSVILHTYTSSGTWIGQKSYSVRYKVPHTSEFLPTFTLSAAPSSESSFLEKNGIFAAGISRAYVSVKSAAAKYGGSISKCQITCGGVKSTGYSYTTPILVKGAYTISATVTDSRGLSLTKTQVLQVLPYSSPYASGIDIFRCDADGAANEAGKYIRVSASLSFSDLGGANSGMMSVAYKGHAAESYSSETLVPSGVPIILNAHLQPEASYDVRLTCTDLTENATYHVTYISTSNVDFHLINGKARFGGYCERDGFECDWDANFGGTVSIGGSPIGDFVVESGRDGIWQWRKWDSGLSECFGTTPQKTYELSYGWGALYHTPLDGTGVNSEKYPAGLFIGIPSVQATPHRYSQAVMIMPRTQGSSAASPDYYIVSAVSGNYTVSLNLYCVGRWK